MIFRFIRQNDKDLSNAFTQESIVFFGHPPIPFIMVSDVGGFDLWRCLTLPKCVFDCFSFTRSKIPGHEFHKTLW